MFNEDAGFIVEPPKSIKKKVSSRGRGIAEGTSKPLLLSDWSNAQISNYCDACGIVFANSVLDCINHIRMLEQLRSAFVVRPAETSVEGHET